MKNVFSMDVEDWFHILESRMTPSIDMWANLESRVAMNVERILELLDDSNVRATMFWLGWVAERHKSLVLECHRRGHEIASHGYAHLMINRVGREAFRRDVVSAKRILEDIIGQEVTGFRAPGFTITDETRWAYTVLRESGYLYDSSVFPCRHRHGGNQQSVLVPHIVETPAGPVVEVPISALGSRCFRVSMFGGGRLRLFPKWLICWGVGRLRAAGRPVILYIHPRDVDPDQPRTKLGFRRTFETHYGIRSTIPKLRWLFKELAFCTMRDLVLIYKQHLHFEAGPAPIIRPCCDSS